MSITLDIEQLLPEELEPPKLPIESERTPYRLRIWLAEAQTYCYSHPIKETFNTKESVWFEKQFNRIRKCLDSEATKLRSLSPQKRLLVAAQIAQHVIARLNATYLAGEMVKAGGKMTLRNIPSQTESIFDDAEDVELEYSEKMT